MALKYIDTHAHLNLEQFAADRNDVFSKCLDAGVGMINVGTNRSDSKLSLDLAQQYSHAWSIIGLHPINVFVGKDNEGLERGFDYQYYKELAEAPEVIGIGECGFDYWHNSEDTHELQREAFLAQVELANELGKPLMLHLRNVKEGGNRDAYDDALDILRSEAKVRGNAHFYAGSVDQARQFLELGYTISFTGVITFAQAAYQEVVQYVPLDMMHGETDCPFVAPAPYRGQRADPAMVIEVYKAIAAIRGEDEEIVREQLLKNAQDLYKIDI